MKKTILITLGTIMALSATAFAATPVTTASGNEETPLIGMPNPWTDYDSLDEAEKAAGFTVAVPEKIDGFDEVSYRYCKDTGLLEVIFNKGDSEIRFRKALGSDDVSGDYTLYPEVSTLNIDGSSVITKGSDGKIQLAVWNGNGYTYSVTNTDGLSRDVISEYITEMTDDVPLIGGDPATWGPSEDGLQIANPWDDAASMEDAKKTLGFDIAVPESINGCSDKAIRVMAGDDAKILEIVFSDSNGKQAVVRKAPGSGDISDDYNNYAKIESLPSGRLTITAKGGYNTVNLAVWENNGYTYSVYVNTGISSDAMAKLAAEIH